MPTTRAKRKRRGSVAVAGLSNGAPQWRTRGRLLVPFSLAQTAKKVRRPGFRARPHAS